MTDKVSKRSIGLNTVLFAIKGMLNVAFPIITFPYVSRILGVENMGAYNFSNSIVSYVTLIAGLGISTYAIREGARQRDKIESFANQIFTLNLLSTVLAYVILGIALISFEQLGEYRRLILILSLQTLFQTIGVEWIYSVYEDYLFITLRSIFLHIASLVMLFLFVKERGDVEKYAVLTVAAHSGANIFNYIYAQKYNKFKIAMVDFKQHLKPIVILFAFNATVTIYVSTDTTILGILCGNHTTGIYGVSAKAYSVLKTIMASALTVSIPRLSAFLGQGDIASFKRLSNNTYNTFLTYILPAITGVIILRREIVLMISSSEYLEAITSLLILALALFFCLGAGFWGQCILIPLKREKTVFIATAIGAAVNLFLNMVLIPIWKENAAAVTTLIAEMLVFFICRHRSKEYIKIDHEFRTMAKVIAGCIMITLVGTLTREAFSNNVVYIVSTIVLSIIGYGLIEMVLKNEIVTGIVKNIRRFNFKSKLRMRQ